MDPEPPKTPTSVGFHTRWQPIGPRDAVKVSECRRDLWGVQAFPGICPRCGSEDCDIVWTRQELPDLTGALKAAFIAFACEDCDGPMLGLYAAGFVPR